MEHGEIFQHGVASGDPLADRVILWTRVTAGAAPVEVEWRVARDAELADVVRKALRPLTPSPTIR
jgi:alkaline phosphatase D